MTVRKRIVCLANSRKLQGRCIAGCEMSQGRPNVWIRPVSDREHEEVSEYERQYEDGSDPMVMDMIDVPLREPRPKGYQQENWLIDPDFYWVKVGALSWDDLEAYAVTDGTLWINGHRTFHGVNDFFPLDQAGTVRSSLTLIHVDMVELRVLRPGENFGNPKRRVQGRFTFAGNSYSLRVTDPKIEREYLAHQDGRYSLGESYLTISLGEPFEGNCYKLIAAVIQKD
ncbi:MAG: hypothetical protein JSR31_08845 [Nitrospira sp.]|nr:hypothetical protein [Nitrospira sp.]